MGAAANALAQTLLACPKARILAVVHANANLAPMEFTKCQTADDQLAQKVKMDWNALELDSARKTARANVRVSTMARKHASQKMVGVRKIVMGMVRVSVANASASVCFLDLIAVFRSAQRGLWRRVVQAGQNH